MRQVAANQLLLAPVTVSTVLSWNLAWTGKADHIPDKLRTDMLPTMQNGWKFWVPAASINFFAIPLQYQVRPPRAGRVRWETLLPAVARRQTQRLNARAGAVHVHVRRALDRLPLLRVIHTGRRSAQRRASAAPACQQRWH